MLDRPTLKIVTVIIIASLLIVTGALVVPSMVQPTHDAGTDTPTTAEWTSFFWFCGDGNLGDYNMMLCNIHFLEQVNSSDAVNMIGILDKEEEGDTKLLKIEEGNSTALPLSAIDPSWTDNELNLGDPEPLLAFLEWGVENYPAERYNIHLVNHGGGWRGMCWDERSDDHLSLPEIRSVTEGFMELTGEKVDILSTEGCLVGMLEFAYELRGSCDYFVGGSTYGWGAEAEPEQDVWEAGNWQYDRCWQRLVDEPMMDAAAFATVMTETFEPWGPWRAPPYIPKQGYSDVMATFNLSHIEPLAQAVGALALELKEKVTGIGQAVNQGLLINTVIGHPELPDEYHTESFSAQMDWAGISTYTNYDLYDLAYMLSQPQAGPLRSEHATTIMDLVDDVIMQYRCLDDPAGHPDAHGISIYIPYRSSTYNPAYADIQFAQDTQWDEFITAVHWA